MKRSSWKKCSRGVCRGTWTVHPQPLVFLLAIVLVVASCGSRKVAGKKNDFFTSGSREADQRASQRMAQSEQLTGSGEGSGERGARRAKPASPGSESGTNLAARVEGKLALYDRLGAESGISNLIADFLPRATQDPRVNWQRKGVRREGLAFWKRNETPAWSGTPEETATLKRHLGQFLALATGGPAQYDGKDMKSAHSGMRISNPEFDAAIGDLKASLDRLRVPNKEQKELLAIVESTRPQVVTDR